MTSDHPKTHTNPTDEMESLLAGHFVAQSLHCAAVLGIADHLKDGPKTTAELAVATGCQETFLRRLLCTLASKGVLKGTDEDQFSLTALGDTLRCDATNSLRNKAIFEASPPFWAAVGGLLDTLRTGEPSFDHVHNMSFFQYMAENQDIAAVFNSFMTAQSALQNTAIVDAYDFSDFRRIVDVGGGHGATLAAILNNCPDTQGILFDLPEVVADVSPNKMGLSDRLTTSGGDMLASVPEGGDAYLIKRVMMDKTDDDAVKVLRHCLASMNKNGKVFVIDPMLTNMNEPHHNWLADILMMVVVRGRCRTEEQFKELFGVAGLTLVGITETSSPNFILEGVRQ